MDFSTLGISPPYIEILKHRGIESPTEIQQRVIPFLLEKPPSPAGQSGGFPPANLIFTAPTGSGKTLAYLLPIFQKLNLIEGRNTLQALILAPTHELCSQIKKELESLSTVTSAEKTISRPILLIGSVPLNRQIETLKKNKPMTAVGNPARVLQLIRMKKLSLRSLRFLVLDEGDRLMAEELFPETSVVFSTAFNEKTDRLRQPDCRFIACSATFSAKSRERLFSLGPQNGPDWKYIETKAATVLQQNIEHWAFFAEKRKKISLLRSLLAAAQTKTGLKALVFCSRGGDAGNIVSQLQYHHLAAGGIWGDMDRKLRKTSLDDFRKGSLSVLVSSDLACRGLDIEGISHVIALDIPENHETYLHRAGRTGRAGKQGIMVSIGNEAELRCLQRIEKKLGITVYPKELYGGRIIVPE
ncbi:MAG: DEAD/DEAH box helicase [Treponema sp.]|jgi:superfamily II DNA/RNA helicase|nr:DEAD/DEAH box helicase [Treponema sp.]